MRWVDLVRAAALSVGALILARNIPRRRLERAVAARLGPPGADGVIPGAGPIALDGGDRVALLLHGFGDTPESLEGLAQALHVRGWTVRVPLLAGHGRTLHEFARSGRAAWEADARAAYDAAVRTGKPVAIVGQSMGAALAVQLAATHPELSALVLLAPLLSLTPTMERAASWWRLLAAVRPLVDGTDERSIHEPRARRESLGYGAVPVRLAPELAELVRAAQASLGAVRAPTLIIQSREDNRVTSAGTEAAAGALGAPEVELVWRTGAGHVLSVDTGREEVWALTADWLERHPVAVRSATA